MTSGWSAYLDGLECVANVLEAGLAAALAATDADPDPHASARAWLPAVPQLAVPLPDGPPPQGSQARREELLTRLVVLTDRLERRRDDVAHQLASLPSRRPRSGERHAGALGGTLDLQG
jgi:hypothetical protein